MSRDDFPGALARAPEIPGSADAIVAVKAPDTSLSGATASFTMLGTGPSPAARGGGVAGVPGKRIAGGTGGCGGMKPPVG